MDICSLAHQATQQNSAWNVFGGGGTNMEVRDTIKTSLFLSYVMAEAPTAVETVFSKNRCSNWPMNWE